MNNRNDLAIAFVIAVVIVTLMLWCVVTILPAARAHSLIEPPEKDWCYSYVSGQVMPMEYCDGLQK